MICGFVQTTIFYNLTLMYLDVSVYQPIQLDVIVVFAERINQHLGDFQPSDVETKLQENINFIKKRKTIFNVMQENFYATFHSQCLKIVSFMLITCSTVKNGKYMSGCSYFPLLACSTNCLPSKAEKK